MSHPFPAETKNREKKKYGMGMGKPGRLEAPMVQRARNRLP